MNLEKKKRHLVVSHMLFKALSSEFASEATKRAKIIVHELHLPLHAKTIRPIDAGGIAGETNSMNFYFLLLMVLSKAASSS
jgi:hypothetical protein